MSSHEVLLESMVLLSESLGQSLTDTEREKVQRDRENIRGRLGNLSSGELLPRV